MHGGLLFMVENVRSPFRLINPLAFVQRSAQRSNASARFLPDLDWGDPAEADTIPGHMPTVQADLAAERRPS